MASKRSFVDQLENFRREAYVAAQYLYSEMAVQHAASKSSRLLGRLNQTPRFWSTHSAACQEAAYLTLGRVFDTKSDFNVNELLNTFESSLSLFSRQALAERKRDGKASDPSWLANYLEGAHYPTAKDVTRLRAKTAEYRAIYDRAIKPARHKYIAHREKVDQAEVQKLFGGGKVRELWRMVTFLYSLYEALSQQQHNGRKPVLGRMRYSVKVIFDSESHGSAPHEAVVAETKQLMAFIETATPQPLLERTRKPRLRSTARKSSAPSGHQPR
jgi:AbiU2